MKPDPSVKVRKTQPKSKENIQISVDLTSLVKEIGEKCLCIAEQTTFTLAEQYLVCVDKVIQEVLKQSK